MKRWKRNTCWPCSRFPIFVYFFHRLWWGGRRPPWRGTIHEREGELIHRPYLNVMSAKFQFILTHFHKSFLGIPFVKQKLLFQHVSSYVFAIYCQSSWSCTIWQEKVYLSAKHSLSWNYFHRWLSYCHHLDFSSRKRKKQCKPFVNQKLLFQHVSCYVFAIYCQSYWTCTILAERNADLWLAIEVYVYLFMPKSYTYRNPLPLLQQNTWTRKKVRICLHASKNCNHRSIFFYFHQLQIREELIEE